MEMPGFKQMSNHEIEQLKKYFDEKIDPLIEQHDEMFQAYTTLTQGGTWITSAAKYILYAVGTLLAIYVAWKKL
jgi:hypothetical protein